MPVVSVTARNRVPHSHVALGKIGLPWTKLVVTGHYGAENRGTAPGRVAVKLNLIEKKSIPFVTNLPDDTWVRYTPLKDDDTTSEGPDGVIGQKGGPGIIRDKIWADTNKAHRTVVSPATASIRLAPGEKAPVDGDRQWPWTIIELPGGGVSEIMRQWWLKAKNANMKVILWLQWISDDGFDIKMVDKHEFNNAFSFSSDFVSAPQFVQLGSGLSVTSR